MTKYIAISPDGIPIRPKPFASEQKACDYIVLWSKRYQSQGYYLTANWKKIPLSELLDCVRIIPCE